MALLAAPTPAGDLALDHHVQVLAEAVFAAGVMSRKKGLRNFSTWVNVSHK